MATTNNVQQIKYGVFHAHSEHSLKDSTLRVKELVERCAELGAPAVTLTDHGTVSGFYEFMNAQNEINDDFAKKGIDKRISINLIPGVEAYVYDENLAYPRAHFILVAKNYQGFQAISKAVTESNHNIQNGFPVMTLDIFRKYFGKNSIGYNNVFATSACVGGYLATILKTNFILDKEIDKINNKLIKKFSNKNVEFDAEKLIKQIENNTLKIENLRSDIDALIEKRDILKKVAGKKYSAREKAVKRFKGDEYITALEALEKDKKETENAIVEVENVKKEIKNKRNELSKTNKVLKIDKELYDKIKIFHDEISAIAKNKVDDNELYQQAKDAAIMLQNIFGKGNFLIELQYHRIKDEAFVMPILAKLADECNIPVIAANDVHFKESSYNCIRARQLIKSLRFNKIEPLMEGDNEYYVKTDEELKGMMCEILPENVVNQAIQNIGYVAQQCNVVLPNDKHYPKYKDDNGNTVNDALPVLKKLIDIGIKEKFNGRLSAEYKQRIEYELEIIQKMGYTDYLCIVQDYVAYGKKLGKQNPEKVGYTIGVGRGSAVGSLVCYIIGITGIDPIPMNLLFERFLNPDRVSAPDIDVDFSPEIRDKVIEYLKQKYGEEAICHIMTHDTLASKNSIHSVARILGDEEKNDTRAYYTLGNEISKELSGLLSAEKKTIKDCSNELKKIFSSNSKALQIINEAQLIEGTRLNYGIHAAGVILSDNADVSDYVTLMWNDKKAHYCCQCNMIEAEANAGLLKFDFLGLINLKMITDTLRLIKKNTGKEVDIEKVPMDKKVFSEIFAKGNTDFVFQFESQGMKKLLKDYKPKNIEDLTLLNALYRPGPLQYAEKICNVRKGKIKPTYISKAAKDVLEVTFGFPVYQEQIMQLCNKVAGFSLGESDIIRRYMSKKKEDKMAYYRPKFIKGIVDSGASEKDAEQLWNEIIEFAKYAFNKSHAAAYSTIAYYTGYLKYHYPVEYMTAVFNSIKSLSSKTDKRPMAIDVCRKMNITLKNPDINLSYVDFIDSGAINKEILYGLGTVDNVAASAVTIVNERKENGVFRDFKDFILRCNIDKTSIESLIDAGAFDCFASNREALKITYPIYKDAIKKLNNKKEQLLQTQELHKNSTDLKEKNNLAAKIERLQLGIKELNNKIKNICIPNNIVNEPLYSLEKEKSVLGAYLSGNIFDEYPTIKSMRTTIIANISDIDENKPVTVAGLIKNLNTFHRKADGRPFVIFDIMDETSTIKCIAFCDKYDEYRNLFEENAVLSISGKVGLDINAENKQIYIKSVDVVPKKQHDIIIKVADTISWMQSVLPVVEQYRDEAGVPLIVFDAFLGEFRKVEFKVNKNILNNENLDIRVDE